MSEPLTDAELEEMEKLENVATLGPWETRKSVFYSTARRYESNAVITTPDSTHGPAAPDTARAVIFSETDAAFIAAARSFVPRAIAEIRLLQAKVAELEADRRLTDECAGRVEALEERIGELLMANTHHRRL